MLRHEFKRNYHAGKMGKNEEEAQKRTLWFGVRDGKAEGDKKKAHLHCQIISIIDW